jgi:hypothetical protein
MLRALSAKENPNKVTVWIFRALCNLNSIKTIASLDSGNYDKKK